MHGANKKIQNTRISKEYLFFKLGQLNAHRPCYDSVSKALCNFDEDNKR